MQDNIPILVVGLGNPGDNYKMTRHNAGFMALDFLVGSDAKWEKEKDAMTFSKQISGQKIIFVKPQSFMNNSGLPVRELMAFYKAPIKNLIVIHDDMDLKIGDVRKKIGGGSAGHNGIKSIDANVGNDFTRIRIGIGHPRDFDLLTDPADFVLGKFTKDEIVKINNAFLEIKLSD